MTPYPVLMLVLFVGLCASSQTNKTPEGSTSPRSLVSPPLKCFHCCVSSQNPYHSIYSYGNEISLGMRQRIGTSCFRSRKPPTKNWIDLPPNKLTLWCASATWCAFFPTRAETGVQRHLSTLAVSSLLDQVTAYSFILFPLRDTSRTIKLFWSKKKPLMYFHLDRKSVV